MNQKEAKVLEKVVMDCAMRRKDKRFTPLLVSVAEMVQYGYNIGYVVYCMKDHYDGRPLDNEMYIK